MAIESYEIKWNENCWGTTNQGCTILKNEICNKSNHEIYIIKIETGVITCGFLIIDRTTNQMVFTGDGFRTDGGGEGGRGYKKALEFLNFVGIQMIPTLVNTWDSDNLKPYEVSTIEKRAFILKDIDNQYPAFTFFKISDLKANY